MDTEEINCMLSSETLYVGAFACDQIPRINKRPATLIINTDKAEKPGEHWVAIYLGKGGKGQYFDSYGLLPFNYYIKKFLKENCNNGVLYNTAALQTPDMSSFTCGHYCVLFCMSVSRNISFKKFLKLFSKNTLLNDIAARLAVESNQSCMK